MPPIDTDLFRNPLVIAGMALAISLKVLDMAKTHRYRNRQMNGDNPVVRAITDSADKQVAALQRDGDQTREALATREAREAIQLAAHEAACSQRMRDHTVKSR